MELCETIEEMPVDPIDDIIDYLIHSDKVCFKSQQIGEKDLTTDEKRTIAFDVYKKGNVQFLERFGKNLTLQHVLYFENLNNLPDSAQDYEMSHHINACKTMLSEKGKKCLVKNRRYEALSKMIKDGTYFSEVEMMERNPLLYEQLVGQYMTENEKKARDNIDTQNITLLNVLLEGISKTQTKTTMEKQQEAEDGPKSESESEEDIEKQSGNTWGEFSSFKKQIPKKKTKKIKRVEPSLITAPERSLLREEFVQEMYRSFVDGEDENFDYESVDANSEYDCIEVRGRDEEERYFDTESSDAIVVDHNTSAEESEDELDVFMNHLNKHPTFKK